MNTHIEPHVVIIKATMVHFIEKHPNQQMYRFAAGPGVDAQAARQAGIEVANEKHVPIIVYVPEDAGPAEQEKE